MNPKEYEEKYPLTAIVAKALGVFGRQVVVVCLAVADITGAMPPTEAQLRSNNADQYLDYLESYLKSIQY